MVTKELKTVGDYQDYLRRESKDSNLKPGSQEERFALDGFRSARGLKDQERRGTETEPGGVISAELGALESQEGVVTTGESQIAHQQVEIAISDEGDEGRELAGVASGPPSPEQHL